MRQQIKLFINNLEVDLKEDINILFTYQLEDRTNPTTIKNHFSKNVTIEEVEGSPRNALIFGLFSFDDRRIGQGGTPGNSFDPSKRVPFELFVEGDLQESGYAQLTKVTKKGAQVIYSITLYGGLGDFWYSLHTKDDGNTRTLADLIWKNTDSQGYILPENEEFDFTITKETVDNAWSRLATGQSEAGRQLFDTINFATLYAGTPESFDANKMLINTNGSNAFPSTYTSGDSAYTTVGGYGLAELDKSYESWAVMDLRSYLQKPVLSVRRLVEACCDPENNGGYNVDLDPDFFNMANPYYAKAWMTLPSLIVDSENNNSETYGGNTPFFNPVSMLSQITQGLPSKDNAQMNTTSASTIIQVTGETINTDFQGVMDLSNYPFSYLNIGIDLGMTARANTTLPLDMCYSISHGAFYGIYDNFASTVFAQLVAFDAVTGEKLGGTDIYRMRSQSTIDELLYGWLKLFFRILEDNSYDVTTILGPDFVPGNIVEIKGNFQYDNLLGAHKFVSEDNFNIWRLNLNKLPKENKIIIKLVTNHFYGSFGPRADEVDYYYNWWGDKLGYLPKAGKDGRQGVYTAVKQVVSYGGNVSLIVPSEISSGAKIDKKKLLSTDESAADFLLSYSKMFGLYWYKDIYSKTVYCRMRNNFFTGESENLDDRIDYSKDFITTPLLFDKHFYTMTTPTTTTKYSEKYQDLYSRVYGSQKINTNFNFNNDTKELYDKNIFTNLIQVRDTGEYYKTYFNRGGHRVPTPMAAGLDYTLYSGNSHEEAYTIHYTPNDIDYSRTVDYYPRGGYDFMTHPAAFTDDGDSRGNVPNKYTLLFFDQFVSATDSKGNPIKIYLTDDVNEMISLNGNRCWLWTNSEYNAKGDVVAIPLPTIPSFSRYYQNRLSMDFGTPQEYYIDDLEVQEDGSVYNQFWKKYLNDQFNANTRMVTCYVKFDRRIMEDALRKFYWFNNRMWVLNKVTDYSVTKYNTVKCEFIAVDDILNYTDGQSTPV